MQDTPLKHSASKGPNTQADAILEVSIPDVDIGLGEGSELGVSSDLAYVDGQRRTAGASVHEIAG
jgi:hypothetical protein